MAGKHRSYTKGQAGAGGEGRVPVLRHLVLPGRLANAKAAPAGTAVCTENKFFWCQLEFGRKWLWVAGTWIQLLSAPAEEAGEHYLGSNRVTQKRGPNSPHPIVWRASPPIRDENGEGLERRAAPQSSVYYV